MSSMRVILLSLAALAVLVAVAIRFVLAALARRTGFSFATDGDDSVIASDVGGGASVLLRHKLLGVCGNPDYLLEREVGGARVLVPLEVKPKRRSDRLFDSDRIQIGAYLVALRDSFPQLASRTGYVRYADRTFEVSLTPGLEREIEQLVVAVRRGRTASAMNRSHDVRARCRACSIREHCDEALTG